MADFREIHGLLDAALVDQVFPGGVLAVIDRGAVVHRHAFGRTARLPDVGPAVTIDTIYDCASLTKVVVTTALVMRLVARGALSVDDLVSRWIPDFAGGDKDRVTVRNLLLHDAGLTWWRPFWERLIGGERLGAASARDAIVTMAAADPLEAPPGTRFVYSDLGFLLLGAIVERAGGGRLDVLAQRELFDPLGMRTTQFVDLDQPSRPSPVAATEICPRRGLMVGEVHDENAHAAGGVCGHAGMFSTADDLARFAIAMLDGAHFGREIVHLFATRGPFGTRALGWDTPSEGAGASQAGDMWPRERAIGHMGFTGTSLWLDFTHGRAVVLLTNRVHPSRADERIRIVRPRVHDAITRALAGP